MFTSNKELIIDRCIEVVEREGLKFEWNPNPQKNPHSIGGSFQWNEEHGIDPAKWDSIIVDKPDVFPTISMFVFTVCHEIEKRRLHKIIENPRTEEERYLRTTCDYGRGLYIWHKTLQLAKKEFDLELDMYCGSWLNGLIINGSIGENCFIYDERK